MHQTPGDTTDNRFWFWAAAIVMLALGLRVVGLGRGYWLDEWFTLVYIVPEYYGGESFWANLRVNETPPLYYLLLKGWSGLGRTETVLRLLSVVIGAATVASMIGWLRTYRRSAALLGGLLAATLPLMIRYGSEMRAYGLLTLLTVLSFWAARNALRDPNRKRGLLMLSAAWTGLVLTHAVSVFVVTAVGATMLADGWARRKDTAVTIVLAGLAPVLITGVLYLWYLTPVDHLNAQAWYMPPPSLAFLADLGLRLIGWQTIQDLTSRVGGRLPIGSGMVSLLAIAGSVAIAGAVAVLGRWRESWALLAGALVFWGLLVLYSHMVLPIVWDRTALVGLVPFIAWFAVQATSVSRPPARHAILLALAGTSLAVGTFWGANRAARPLELWREAAEWYAEQAGPRDVVMAFPYFSEYPFRHYVGWPEDLRIQVSAVGKNTWELHQQQMEDAPGDAAIWLLLRKGAVFPTVSDVVDRLRGRLGDLRGEPELQTFRRIELVRYAPVRPAL